MEPLPTQGQTLRHYTAFRPRPRRTHTQPPSSRPQEPKPEAEHEATEGMGRVDEGVEEFFTKKIIPDYALKGRWEESNSAQATPPDSSSTPLAPLPLTSPSSESIPSCPETTTVSSAPVLSTDLQSVTPTGDAPPTPSTPPSSLPLSSTTTTTTTTNTSTAPKNIKKKFGDFFAFKRARAGRATKSGGGEGGGGESVKVKRTSIADLIRPLREAKDRERERDKERGAKSFEDVNVCNDATEGSAAVGLRLASADVTTMPVKTLTITPPYNETAPAHPTTTTPVPTDAALTDTTQATTEVTVSEPDYPPAARPDDTEQGDKDSKTTGLIPIPPLRTKRSLREGKSQSLILLTGSEPEDKDKAHKKESTNSFEQRLQVMLHRISVARSPPPDTKISQNKEEELRKANSEGAILDKPDSPSYVKPRTMSTSAAERRDPKKAAPLLHPKPPVPEKPLLPKPPVSAKPVLPIPCVPPADTVKLRGHAEDCTTAQSENQEAPRTAPPATLPKTELYSPAQRKPPSAVERSEKAQSVTDESLPKPRPLVKPPAQRRAVSVHEDTLAMTQELKAVLQRSPIRLCGNRGELPTCTEDNTTGEDAQSPHEGSEKLKCERERMDADAKPKSQEREDTICPSSSTTQGQKETSDVQHSPVSPVSQDKSPVQVHALSKTTDKLQISPQSQEKHSVLASPEILQGAPVSPSPSTKKSPSTPPAAKEDGEKVEDVSKQHTVNSASCL